MPCKQPRGDPASAGTLGPHSSLGVVFPNLGALTTAAFPTEAAYGCLKSAPAHRLRRAFLHLRYSIVSQRMRTRSWHNTTAPFARSSTGQFEACSCKPTSEGLLPSSVQHPKLALGFVTHAIGCLSWLGASRGRAPRTGSWSNSARQSVWHRQLCHSVACGMTTRPNRRTSVASQK